MHFPKFASKLPQNNIIDFEAVFQAQKVVSKLLDSNFTPSLQLQAVQCDMKTGALRPAIPKNYRSSISFRLPLHPAIHVCQICLALQLTRMFVSVLAPAWSVNAQDSISPLIPSKLPKNRTGLNNLSKSLIKL